MQREKKSQSEIHLDDKSHQTCQEQTIFVKMMFCIVTLLSRQLNTKFKISIHL